MEARTPNGDEHAETREAPFIEGKYRRDYKEWFKAQVVEECAKPGSSVSTVARRHDINSNVLFRWRREYRVGIIRPSARPPSDVAFVPAGVIDADGKLVTQAPAKPAITAPPPAKAKPPAIKDLPVPIIAPAVAKPNPSTIELHLSGWIKMIRIQGDAHKEALQNVLAVAKELA
jgi:transposase